MDRRRLIIVIIAVVIVLGIGAAIASPNSPAGEPATGGGGASSATMLAKVRANLTTTCLEAPTADWCPDLMGAPGTWDIAMNGDSILVVAISALSPNADTICHAIAAASNDQDTAEPIGYRHVTVIANGTAQANCDTP